MTNKNASTIRAAYVAKLSAFLAAEGEDCAPIASNTLNFPVVGADGEEGFVEIVVRVPKETADDDGFAKRTQYGEHLAELAAKATAAAERKAKKIAADKARRAAKATAK